MKKLLVITGLAILLFASIMAANGSQIITNVEKVDIPTKMIEVYANSSFLVVKTTDGTPTLGIHHYAEYDNATGILSITQNTQKKSGRYTRGDRLDNRTSGNINYGNFTISWQVSTWKNGRTNTTWIDEIVAATVTQEGPYYEGMTELLYNQTSATLAYPIYRYI